MSTATAKASTPRRDANTSRTISSPAANKTPARSGTPTSKRSANEPPVSARAAARKPAAPSRLASQADAPNDDAREEQAAFLQDLKDRLQEAETEADERRKQVQVLNAKLDEALLEQAKLEERAHEEEEKVESLENVKRELTRQHRELEGIYEAERAQSMKEKDEMQTREESLHETIQRLKESAATKNTDSEDDHVSRASFRNNPSRSSSSQNLEGAASFAPPSSIQRSDSRSNSKLINQKDKIIEDLRLELAEYQVKFIEVENAGGGRMAELEKQLLETRMTNARLMEDNESFQLLLGEKTLNGDLSRGDFLRESSHAGDVTTSGSAPKTSLADELESAEESEVEAIRKLEADVATLKGENKALTLYINKIIGRLLTHQGFEAVLTDDADNAGGANKNKQLPPPPPEDGEPQGFLQRAKSVAMGQNRKPRPSSIVGPSPSAHEDPATAPSIPLGRSTSTRKTSGTHSHRRSTSEVPGAANVVNKMYNPQSTTPGATSPGIVSPRNSFFGGLTAVAANSNPTSRAASGQQIPTEGSIQEEGDAKSEGTSVDTPSPPRRLERTETAGPMTGKGMRPLRLVQNEQEAAQARKAANRASWFGGLFGQAPPKVDQEN